MSLKETNRAIPKEGLKWTDLQVGDTIYIPKIVNDFITTYLVEITSITEFRYMSRQKARRQAKSGFGVSYW